MLTIIACPKPFTPPFDVIQRRAIRSWKAVHPDVQIMLAGDEAGVHEAAEDLGVELLPPVVRTPEGGLPFRELVDKCLPLARHELLAYVNADILLTPNILCAARAIAFERFLMMGYRLDLPERPVHFDPDAEPGPQLASPEVASELALTTGCDYFVFTRGTWGELPPLTIGRAGIENGLIREAIRTGVPVIDSTFAVTAIHQFHDYSHLRGGRQTAFEGRDAQVNLEICGPIRPHPRDASLVLIGGSVRRLSWRGDWFSRWVVYRPAAFRSRAGYGLFRVLHWVLRKTRISCRRDPSPAEALAAQLAGSAR